MERGFVRKSGAVDAEFGVFATEISRNVWLDSMITRDLVLLMHRSCLSVKKYTMEHLYQQ